MFRSPDNIKDDLSIKTFTRRATRTVKLRVTLLFTQVYIQVTHLYPSGGSQVQSLIPNRFLSSLSLTVIWMTCQGELWISDLEINTTQCNVLPIIYWRPYTLRLINDTPRFCFKPAIFCVKSWHINQTHKPTRCSWMTYYNVNCIHIYTM